MARHVPTVMLFSSSTNGISHAKEEDTPIEHLELAIRAYAQTVGAAIDRVAGRARRRQALPGPETSALIVASSCSSSASSLPPAISRTSSV